MRLVGAATAAVILGLTLVAGGDSQSVRAAAGCALDVEAAVERLDAVEQATQP